MAFAITFHKVEVLLLDIVVVEIGVKKLLLMIACFVFSRKAGTSEICILLYVTAIEGGSYMINTVYFELEIFWGIFNKIILHLILHPKVTVCKIILCIVFQIISIWGIPVMLAK